jgi:D-serine deaminase-like pyridoxal phosphate-dependent protein
VVLSVGDATATDRAGADAAPGGGRPDADEARLHAERVRLDAATAHLDPPFAALDLDAFDANAADLARRARGVPIRIASKSLRCRAAIDRALVDPATRGIMAFTLPEALWLHGLGYEDLLVAYPTVDRAAIRALAADEAAVRNVTLMVDDPAHLDLIDAEVAAIRRAGDVRLCLELDASLRGWQAAGCTSAPVARRCTTRRTPSGWRPRSSCGRGSCWTD